MKTIPVFLIEEHHEAFLIWNYAIKKKLIPERNNTLYHIDEHSDMNTPRFNKSIHNSISEFHELKNFTYEELSIANFIIPAIYQGIFDKVYWFRQRANNKKHKSSYFVRSYNQQGKKIISGIDRNSNIEDKDRKLFKYYTKNIENAPATNKQIILDIDLDYFSCAGELNDFGELLIEITKSEYKKFKSNKYHRINYIGLNKVDAIKEGEKYYYLINYFEEIYECPLKVDSNTIKGRIKILGDILNSKKIKPHLITICRSKHSGYTPNDQWEYIELELIKMLKNEYNLSITNINDMQLT